MSAPIYDGQPLTKREVLIARDAFGVGVHAAHAQQRAARDGQETALYWVDGKGDAILRLYAIEPLAEGEYPLPKVTRPRVAVDPQGGCYGGEPYYFRVDTSAGQPQVVPCDALGAVMGARAISVTASRVALWADLLANPTEEVEE